MSDTREHIHKSLQVESKRIQEAFALSTVQIVATYVTEDEDGDENTIRVTVGNGDWYARFGAVSELVEHWKPLLVPKED